MTVDDRYAGQLAYEVGRQTPVQVHDGIVVKRDDLFGIDGQWGGKVRTCWTLAAHGVQHTRAPGLVTAGSRHSPQVAIVATVAARLHVPCRVHVPAGDSTPEIEWAEAHGAEVVRHRPGHNSVIVARARTDAEATRYVHIPFGMETNVAVEATGAQVDNLCGQEWGTLVVPVGSGMSLAGILHGLERLDDRRPVVGVVVGADPTKRLDRYAPPFWRQRVTLVAAAEPYHVWVPHVVVGDVLLDPVYEAKCARYLHPGDALWIVGRRASTTEGN